jgi:hypothetical protein
VTDSVGESFGRDYLVGGGRAVFSSVFGVFSFGPESSSHRVLCTKTLFVVRWG